MRAGYIIKDNGSYIQIWATKFIFKGIIAVVINRTVVVLQC